MRDSVFQVWGTAYANSQEYTKVWLGQGTVWSEGNYEEVLMTLKKFKGNKLIMEEEVGGSEAVGGNCSHADPEDPYNSMPTHPLHFHTSCCPRHCPVHSDGAAVYSAATISGT